MRRTEPSDFNNAKLIEVEQKICRKFAQIHAILQMEEETLLREVMKMRGEEDNCLEMARKQLEANIQVFFYLMKYFEKYACNYTEGIVGITFPNLSWYFFFK